ncbi:hypothetical protein Hanom_Chr17g01574711 [Helianthus anomalus]
MLKYELAKTDKKNNKLPIYHDSSYILERVFQIPHLKRKTENKHVNKGKGSEYYQVRPQMMGNYCQKQLEEMENVLKDENENDSTKNVNSTSQDEDEVIFHKTYLKNSKPKSETITNDDPIMLAYQMIGSDKLFSDAEHPIQNVIVE